MTDNESDAEERYCRVVQTKDREYSAGWRAYVNGQPCPSTPVAADGWREAEYADQQLGRDIRWSAGESVVVQIGAGRQVKTVE